jgi:uncharacterized protein YkwD
MDITACLTLPLTDHFCHSGEIMRSAITMLCLAALSACSSSSTGTNASASRINAPAATTTVPSVAENNTFAGLLNNVRLANAAPNVAYDAKLGLTAQGHANDMLANNFFSHTGSNGSSIGDRATAAGYVWKNIAENIAMGQASQQQVLTDWTNSPGHHANNINPVYEDFGLAQAGSGGDRRWVLVLGRD